jgi:hypothetical protein
LDVGITILIEVVGRVGLKKTEEEEEEEEEEWKMSWLFRVHFKREWWVDSQRKLASLFCRLI